MQSLDVVCVESRECETVFSELAVVMFNLPIWSAAFYTTPNQLEIADFPSEQFSYLAFQCIQFIISHFAFLSARLADGSAVCFALVGVLFKPLVCLLG